ncbi:alpha/beta hydrolase family protein [Clostridium sp. D33t1_170424_F3]|uniref:alpha/beta hydrolase n=1 Tax=Clostridium sp. D33t1_170424_F3 TaxID=2787099 RepID=UPI0018A90C72|nr:alpha/beta hydrolase family protein [Clostridium sp. D33t1_170424_F3]
MATLTGNFYSHILGMDTSVTIISPRKKLLTDRPYRTVYVLHGLTDNNSSWAYNAQLSLLAEQYQTVFILPDGARSFYINMKYGQQYFTYLSKELPELTRNLLRLSPSREETGVFGLSMGGYGALECGLLRPDVFGFCGSFSGCCDIYKLVEVAGQNNAELQGLFGVNYEDIAQHDLFQMIGKAAQQSPQAKFYAACGTQDFLLDMNRRFSKAMQTQGFAYQYEEFGGSHEWYFWNQAVHRAMQFFFPLS